VHRQPPHREKGLVPLAHAMHLPVLEDRAGRICNPSAAWVSIRLLKNVVRAARQIQFSAIV
jgi:hypothetical protein